MGDDYNQIYREKDLKEQYERGFNEANIKFKEFVRKLKTDIKLSSDADNLISYGEVFEIIEEIFGKELTEEKEVIVQGTLKNMWKKDDVWDKELTEKGK